MSASDYFIEITEDGKVILTEENDGHRFMRRGPEPVESEISHEEAKMHHPELYAGACRHLERQRELKRNEK